MPKTNGHLQQNPRCMDPGVLGSKFGSGKSPTISVVEFDHVGDQDTTCRIKS